MHIASINMDSVILEGEGCKAYLTENSRITRDKDGVLKEFDTREERNQFLQHCIGEGIPFANGMRSEAYRQAELYVNKGILKGKVKSIDA